MSQDGDVGPYFKGLLEHLPLMVFVKHASDLRFAYVNEAAERVLGLTRADLFGKTDHDFFPAEQADAFIQRDRAVLGSGEPDVVDEPIDTAHGERWLRTRKAALTDDDGTPRFLLGVSEDITERKEREAALKAANRALEETLAQLMALEPLAVTGQQARSFAADLQGTATRGDAEALNLLVRGFYDSTHPSGNAPPLASVDLNEVVTTVGHQRPQALRVKLAPAPLTCVGGRADAVELAAAFVSYLHERSTSNVTLGACVDDGLPRLRFQAEGHVDPVERVRLLRPGALLPDVSATVRARLAIARSAALRSGAQLFSRTEGRNVILDVVFEPLGEAPTPPAAVSPVGLDSGPGHVVSGRRQP